MDIGAGPRRTNVQIQGQLLQLRPRGTHVPRLNEKPDDRLNSLAGRSYDEIRAFFYDQQVNEMKAQGKEFGA
ncbi:hypothetical protein SERLA73DRAFT_81550 [Serpula lacrymans var. lacrymans S7.3]|uniref:Uncharacterized protein n=1 Tax=Serpula lacrymans var. lacrymans (strain S7.3) TaxID=936435 RepID=F8QL29_SERL3|nr:hypothetical protein SERLA73DRAFT_81550 [Serpula lacrymans var. lacrymans S7.3]